LRVAKQAASTEAVYKRLSGNTAALPKDVRHGRGQPAKAGATGAGKSPILAELARQIKGRPPPAAGLPP